MLSNNTKLIQQIDDHIINNNQCSSWNNLDDIHQQLLVAEAIRGLGDEAYVCITESDELGEILKELRRHLTTFNPYDLADAMTRAVTKYFEAELEELFERRKDALLADFYHERGLYPKQHADNGEIYFSRGI